MENQNYKEDNIYYKELQVAARSYNTKLWAILGLFGGLTTLVIKILHFSKLFIGWSFSLENTIILFSGSLFAYALILHFYKAHFYHLSIQKKIDRFDDEFNKTQTKDFKRMPLESMTDRKLKERIAELECDPRNETYFGCIQKCLIKKQVSLLVRRIMGITFILMVLAFVWSLVLLFF